MSASRIATVTDSKTGKSVQIPVDSYNTIPAPRLNDVGLRSYDPAYLNTAVARSKICEVDGDNGILRYGGYPIEQIAEHGTHTEVAFLLHHGELPTAQQQSEWNKAIMEGTEIPGQLVEMLKYFDRNAHPMGALVSLMSALGTFNPDDNPALRGQDMFRGPSPKRMATMARMIGSISTIAAAIFRHHSGLPFIAPDPSLGYAENFLYMCFGKRAQPELVRAMDVLFIAHADHEMNCSTAAIRHVGSSLADPYLAVSGAIAALAGPLHGGANEAVVRMLQEIGTPDQIPEFIDGVKQRKRKLMGMGHRIYKNYDPRAKLIQKLAYQVFDVLGKEPLIEVAVALEQRALSEDFFKSRKLYPNVDFYSGLIYRAMGFPVDFFPVLFAVPRCAGWLAHWAEGMDVAGAQIWRPRQVYVGYGKRDWVEVGKRSEVKAKL